jgi:hypothetical protein
MTELVIRINLDNFEEKTEIAIRHKLRIISDNFDQLLLYDKKNLNLRNNQGKLIGFCRIISSCNIEDALKLMQNQDLEYITTYLKDYEMKER